MSIQIKSMNPKNSFPGYEYIPANKSEDNHAHNMYKGFDVGFGGFVWANPGMYGPTVTYDVSGLHPASIIQLTALGEEGTKNFKDIVDARLAIKHKDFDKARTMLDGKLAPYLNDESQAKMLTGALKIAVNSVYGLTSAKFDNPFRDPRNVNNIVALRGALFMVDLKEKVEAMGGTVIHIKTDSIKIVQPTKEITDFVYSFANDYGYSFEVEHSFEKICLVNNAVYIAKLAADDPEAPGEWTATGKQFQVPYVFKVLFSHEPIIFDDLCETKSVTGDSAIYLDMNEELGEDRHDYHYVGKVGQFCPMVSGAGGGILLAKRGEKYDALAGTKGYRWMESEMVRMLGKEDLIDRSYYDKLANDAVDDISKFGDFEWFSS